MDKPINNDTPIMGNCLSCQGLVRVPSTAPTSSTVKCPHCGESFRLSQILNHAVPALEIVTEGQEEDRQEEEGTEKDSEGRFVVAKQLRQSSKKSRRKRRRSRRPTDTEGMVPVPKPLVEDSELATATVDEADSSRFAVSDAQSGSPRESFDSRRSSGRRSSGSRSSSSESRSRSSSRSKTKSSGGGSAVGEIIKVVLGGAMAIPIAYLLVLWVFRQDPLHVAPKVMQTAPFLLPAEFRIEAEEVLAAEEDTESNVLDDLESDDEILDVSDGLPKPRRDPGKVLVN